MDKDNICFVIMPISDAPSYEAGHFNRVYEYIIKPAVIKSGFTPLRADEVKNTNFIITDILRQIISSSMCICDLSSRNSNVLYELGIRHAFRLPVTLIRDSKTPRIFDIQGLRDIEYDENLRVDNVNSSIDIIAETIINTHKNKAGDINSIIDLLGAIPISYPTNNNYDGQEDYDHEKYNLEVCVDKYLKFKEMKGVGEATLKIYKGQLQFFMEHVNKNVNEISTEDIKSFLLYREKNSNISSNNTMERIRSILKSFFDWLIIEELISKNPIKRIKTYKISVSFIESLNDEEIDILRAACISMREKALLEILYSTGCRLSELSNMEIDKVNFELNEIIIVNNTKASRIVYLTPQAQLLLKDYLNSRKDDNPALFVTSKKPHGKLGNRSIQQEVENIANRAGLDKEIAPSIFRNTFIKNMLNKGCPMHILQELTGHKYHASTTATVFRLNADERNEIYQKYYL